MILHSISPRFSQRFFQCTSNFENICNFPKYWDVLKYHMTDWSLFVLCVQICCTNSNCGADKWWTASILQLEKTSIILQVGELSKSINIWVLPKCFHWIQWQKIFVIKNVRTCGCYHSTSKTQVINMISKLT